MANVLIPLAPGCEELEAVTIIDILRRAEINVTTASLHAGPITASRGTKLIADTLLDDAMQHDYDMVVLPGGLPGADNLNEDSRIHQLLEQTTRNNKIVGAICAAPKVLATAGLLEGKKATAYPGVLEACEDKTIHVTNAAIEKDGNVFTSRGPGTAMDFALEIIDSLVGEEKRKQVEEALQRPV